MTIFRVKHDKNNPYTLINRHITEDNRISWKAKGIWLYAFSRPDDWSFNMTDLVKRSSDGRDSVSKGLRELEEAGYLERTQRRGPDGKLGNADWIFYETPREIQKMLPQTDFPHTVNPSTENPPLLSTESLPSKKDNNRPEPPPPPDPTPKEVVVVSSELDVLNLSDAQKRSVCAKLAPSLIATLVKRVLAWKGRSSDSVAVSHIIANWDSWDDSSSETEEQRIEKHRKLAKRVQDSYMPNDPTSQIQFDVLNQHCEFHHASFAMTVDYSDRNFEHLLKEAMKKCGWTAKRKE